MFSKLAAAAAPFLAALALAASSQAYVHQANAESACDGATQPAAVSVFTGNGFSGLVSGYRWGFVSSSVMQVYMDAPNRVSDTRILVSVGDTSFAGLSLPAGQNPMAGDTFRCDVRSTNGADSGIYIYSTSTSGIFIDSYH